MRRGSPGRPAAEVSEAFELSLRLGLLGEHGHLELRAELDSHPVVAKVLDHALGLEGIDERHAPGDLQDEAVRASPLAVNASLTIATTSGSWTCRARGAHGFGPPGFGAGKDGPWQNRVEAQRSMAMRAENRSHLGHRGASDPQVRTARGGT
ncbi:MAG: hypothetical protein ACLQCU_01195 [Acidimicrobiales bacterium]